MPKRVLIVDDEQSMQEVLAVRIRQAGYDTVGALSAEKAIQLVRQQKPDIAIVDLMLPGKNGWEFCRELKTDPDLKHIPVILLSAMLQQDGTGAGPQEGDYMMAKPYESPKLIAKIQELIGKP